MKLIITVETKEDLPEDAPWDAQDAVVETLKEYYLDVTYYNFEIQS